MGIQTSISDAPAKAYAGQLQSKTDGGAISKAAEGTLVAGQPALRGTDPELQAIAIADSDTVDEATLLGFVLHESSRPYDASAPIEDTDPVTIIRHGQVWVQVTAAVVAGNPVFVGNLTAQLGDIDDAAGTGLVQAPGCRFVTSASASGYALVEINLPAA